MLVTIAQTSPPPPLPFPPPSPPPAELVLLLLLPPSPPDPVAEALLETAPWLVAAPLASGVLEHAELPITNAHEKAASPPVAKFIVFASTK